MNVGRVIAILVALAVMALLLWAPSGRAADREMGPEGCSRHFYGYDPIAKSLTGEGARQAGVRFAPPVPGQNPGGKAEFPTNESKLVEGLRQSIKSIPKGGDLHVLALSGGGEWGAYGAGFLAGWAEADKAAVNPKVNPRRQDIHIIAAVSTGAMQSGFAYPGSMPGDSPEAAAARDKANKALTMEYTSDSTGDLVERRGLLNLLWNNVSVYHADNLERQVAKNVENFYRAIDGMPASRRLYIGAVNLDRGQFVVSDVKSMFDDRSFTEVERQNCLAETLLASAAMPVVLPPRFIDGEMYVDGAVRLGVFASILLNNPEIVEDMRIAKINLKLSVIINGNMSSEPVRPDLEDNMGRPDATLIGVGGATIKNLIDQIYRDSAYRIEMDLRAQQAADIENGLVPIAFQSRFTYVANDQISKSTLPSCVEWVKLREQKIKKGSAVFEPPFMKCLYDIGFERGKNQDRPGAWLPFGDLPALQIN